jgi:hypothetical protein
MMAVLLFLLFVLVLFHWAYESAIAPSWRLGLRYKLFALRDELRNFAAQKGIQLDHTAINTLEESINSATYYMREINFGFIYSFNTRYKCDESFRKRVNHRRAVLEEYQDVEFRAMRKRYEHIFREINLANCGGWMIYLIPIVYVAICWEWLRRLYVKLSVVPSTDFAALSRGVDEACAEPA